MEIQIASDLHIELSRGEQKDTEWVFDFVSPKAEYLALIGDTGCPATRLDQYRTFVHTLAQHYKAVFVVAGNHEFYYKRFGADLKDNIKQKTVWKVKEMIQTVCDDAPLKNVFFMDRRAIEIGDGTVRVVGATLWSQVPLSLTTTIEKLLNDYHVSFMPLEKGDDMKSLSKFEVEHQVKCLKVRDTVNWHKEDLQFISEQVNAAQQAGQTVVILTHHAPLLKGTSAPKFAGSDGNCGFATDLTQMLESEPFQSTVSTWCFGHTHYNSDQMIGRVRLLTNQKGYSREDVGPIPYRKDFTISSRTGID